MPPQGWKVKCTSHVFMFPALLEDINTCPHKTHNHTGKLHVLFILLKVLIEYEETKNSIEVFLERVILFVVEVILIFDHSQPGL